MARNNPVRICVARQSNSREPKFHHVEILDGAGRSINALLIVLRRGWVFRMIIVLIVE